MLANSEINGYQQSKEYRLDSLQFNKNAHYIDTHIHTHTYASIYLSLYMPLCVCVYIYIHTYTCARTHTPPNTHTYICVCVCCRTNEYLKGSNSLVDLPLPKFIKPQKKKKERGTHDSIRKDTQLLQRGDWLLSKLERQLLYY